MTTTHPDPVDAIAETVALCEMGTKDTAQAMAIRHGLTLDELGQVLTDPDFKGIVARKRQAMEQGPDTFKLRARALVDESLPSIKELLLDGSASPSVRKDIWRELSKQAGYSGPEEEAGGRKGPQVKLIIDLRDPADGSGQVLVAHSTGKVFPAEQAAIEEETT